jgi:hypothetical protein
MSVIYPLSLVKSDTFVGTDIVTSPVCPFTLVTAHHALSSSHSYQLLVFLNICPAVQDQGSNHVGILPQSLIIFQVAQSNTAMCQLVELSGHLTSPSPHTQSAPSSISKVSTFQSVSVIVTVVVFQTLVLVILAIQFQSAHGFPCGHFKSATAIICVQLLLSDLYQIYPSSTFMTMLSHSAFTPVLVSHIHRIQSSIWGLYHSTVASNASKLSLILSLATFHVSP